MIWSETRASECRDRRVSLIQRMTCEVCLVQRYETLSLSLPIHSGGESVALLHMPIRSYADGRSGFLRHHYTSFDF